MSNAPSKRLAHLLMQWEALRAANKEIDLEGLCDGDSELLRLLKQEISKLESIDLFLEASTKKYQKQREQSEGQRANPSPTPTTLDRYQIRDQLGQGGFGQVWSAYDPLLQREVAIKMPRPDRYFSEQELDEFLEDARKAASLGDHPHVVKIHDVQRLGSRWMIVSDLVKGQSLFSWMRQQRLTPLQSAQIVAQVASALNYAHQQGIVHRDVKPGNILVRDRQKAFLADFGLAISESEQEFKRDEVAGSFPYMSPEQMRGESQHLDGRSDIYSLGVVLYELLTGRVPFLCSSLLEYREKILNAQPKPLRIIDEKIPKELERICLKCLRKSISDRYTTASDLEADLTAWVESQTAPPIQRRASAPMILGLLLVLVLLLSGVAVSLLRTKKDSTQEPSTHAIESGITPEELHLVKGDPLTSDILSDNNAVRVFSEDLGILSFGQQQQLQSFQVTLFQKGWKGHLGLFFECKTSQEDAKDSWEFHTLLLERVPQDNTHRLLLQHRILSKKRREVVAVFGLKKIPLPPLDDLPKTLAVHFQKGKICDVIFDGKSYAKSLDAHFHRTLNLFSPDLEYTGNFGIWCLNSSGRISSPKLNGKQLRFLQVRQEK